MNEAQIQAAADAVAEAKALCKALSERQRDILVLICKGLRTHQIEEALGIGLKTVEYHRAVALKKLDVGSMAEAAVIATKAGLV